MTTTTKATALRMWPGVVAVLVQWLVTFGSGKVAPGTLVHFFGMMGGPLVGLLLLILWWAFASRASKLERWLIPIAFLAFLFGTFALLDRSAPMATMIYGIPIASLAFVGCSYLARTWQPRPRLQSLLVVLLVACGFWALLRTDGVDGDMAAEFAWRWQETAEERLLAAEPDFVPATPAVAETPSNEPAAGAEADPSSQAGSESAATSPEDPSTTGATAPPDEAAESEVAALGTNEPEIDEAAADEPAAEMVAAAPVAPTPAPVWPGFRGAHREGIVRDVRLGTDWQASPPSELWRRPVGPGWSSVTIVDNLLFTQEQRGEEEIVTAYAKTTGEPVWRHRDTARFWEALAGAGPRATPTWDAGRLYTLGATGLLNALDATTGALHWQRDVAADTGAPTPEWGFSSSPWVGDGLVVVHTGAPEGKGVIAYDATTGEPRWTAPAGPLSYSSAQRVTLDGVDQLLMLTGDGVGSLDPRDGTVLWSHAWQVPNGARIVQPVITPEGDILVGTGFGMGIRRLAVAPAGDGWTVEERWTSKAMKPYYNDFVLHGDHLYGFDGRILVCADVATGERVWKGGRYGNGQLLLLEAQDLLLVLSDRGVVALVEAKPTGYSEVTRMDAIQGKTWNHPVLAEGVLYVRNGEEMAAFAMPEG